MLRIRCALGGLLPCFRLEDRIELHRHAMRLWRPKLLERIEIGELLERRRLVAQRWQGQHAITRADASHARFVTRDRSVGFCRHRLLRSPRLGELEIEVWSQLWHVELAPGLRPWLGFR